MSNTAENLKKKQWKRGSAQRGVPNEARIEAVKETEKFYANSKVHKKYLSLGRDERSVFKGTT